MIKENLISIENRIAKACLMAGRDPSSVKLLLATKTVQPTAIAQALLLGHTLIAENRIQELKEKFDQLKNIPHTSHFIGHLQTNKVKDLLKYGVCCLQTLDRRELADKLNARLEMEDRWLDVLIQVNTSRERSKFGVSPEGLMDFISYVAGLPRLRIKGLMTIGLLGGQADEVAACFRLLKFLQQQVAAQQLPGVEMVELSMGMSGDLEIAISEGATMVRVGTAIFGQRKTADSYYWDEHGYS